MYDTSFLTFCSNSRSDALRVHSTAGPGLTAMGLPPGLRRSPECPLRHRPAPHDPRRGHEDHLVSSLSHLRMSNG